MSDVSSNALPTLYLHIGHPKCGSTTIQRFIELNADALFGKGYLVANSDGHFVREGAVGNPPHAFLNSLLNDAKGPSIIRERVKEGLANAGDGEAKALILSAESLAGRGRAALFGALDDLVSIKIVYYVRRRDEIILSGWTQWQSKRGQSLDKFVERWLSRPGGLFRTTIEQWQDVSGVSDLIVKPVDSSGLTGGDLVSDFADIIGLAEGDFEKPEDANVSFDYDINFLLGQAPEIFDGIHDNAVTNFLERNAMDLVVDRGAEVLGYELRSQIMEAARDDHEYLHKTFFPSLDFDKLFGMQSVKRRQMTYEPDAAKLAGRSFGIMLKLIEKQASRIDELERRLNQSGG